MTIDPYAVAVQGLGFAPKFVVLQGLLVQEDTEPPETGLPRRSRKVVKRRKPRQDEEVLLLLL